jgi:hypothetical protein
VVAETGADRLAVVSGAGTAPRTLATPPGPRGVVAGDAGDLYVTTTTGSLLRPEAAPGAVTPVAEGSRVPGTPALRAGVVRIDASGAVLDRVPVAPTLSTGAVAVLPGAPAVPGRDAGPPASAPSSPDGLPADPAPSTTVLKDTPADRGGSGLWVLVGAVAVAAVVAIGGTLLAARRSARREREGGPGMPSPPQDGLGVADAFGPCAAEEVALAEAESTLRSLVAQRDAAGRRAGEAAHAAGLARERLAGLERALIAAEEHPLAHEVAQARLDLARHERELAEARADIARLDERERDARARVVAARRRLEMCQRALGSPAPRPSQVASDEG